MDNVVTKAIAAVIMSLATSLVWANPAFISGKSYRMSCSAFGAGSVMVGASHDKETPIFYSVTDDVSADGYWVFNAVGDGVYTICNASTGKYITYDGERTDAKRYVDLTDSPDASNSSWRITLCSGGFQIALASSSDQRLNVRNGDDHMVGTYSSSGDPASNEIFTFSDENGNEVYDDASLDNVDKFKIYVDSLFINGKQPVLEGSSNEFLLPVKTAYIEGDYVAVVDAKILQDGYTLTIDGQSVELGKSFNFGNVAGGKSASIAVGKDDSLVASIKVNFTFLPVVEITGSGFNTTTYADGSIRVSDADFAEGDTVVNAKFRYRGATASGKQKKAYAIKLYDAQGESLDRSFFGLRSDNNWILDAMAIDHARMRNRVSTDLWLDFSTKPYQAAKKPKTVNGTRGRFVELLLNGKYAGVYCMTEKVDRKQLQLRKIITHDEENVPDTVRGTLYKSSEWSYSVMMGHYPDQKTYPKTSVSYSSSASETWDGWEAKYPDLSDASSIEWAPLRDALNVVAKGSRTNFEMNVEEYFDLPVFRDYYLFIELMLATDNHGKNMFFYNFDQTEYKMLSITPWDLDGTWGMRWDGSETITADATQDFVTFLWNNEHGESNFFRLLSLYDYKGWKSGLAARYAELRPNFFNPDSLYKRFTDYCELFQASGADTREVNKWNNSDGISLNFNTEMNYLNGWIHKRVAILDEQYGYDEEANGISNVIVDRFTISGADGRIIVTSDNGIKLRVYNMGGVLLRTFDAPPGVSEISGLMPGIYVVNGKKALVK